METLLVPTDFGPDAAQMATYAFHLAEYLRTDIKLYHASSENEGVPGYLKPMESLVRTIKTAYSGNFRPLVKYAIGSDDLRSGVGQILAGDRVPLIAMAAPSSQGQHRREILGSADIPVLLIPPGLSAMPKKALFITTLEESDLDRIYTLGTFARDLDAELCIVTLHSGTESASRLTLAQFQTEVQKRMGFIKLSFLQQPLSIEKLNSSLSELINNESVDMVAINQIDEGLLELLISAPTVPLLVFPKVAVEQCAIF